jgi:hypothetical protein
MSSTLPDSQPSPEKEFDLTSLQQCKSPDSSNVYTMIASSPEVSIGISIEPYPTRNQCTGLNIRFCALANDKPEMKVFKLRGSPKQYVVYLPTVKVQKTGCGMDKISFKVTETTGPVKDLMALLTEDGGWEKIADWIAKGVSDEGMGMHLTLVQLIALLPELVIGFGIAAPKVRPIEYPPAIGTKPAYEKKVYPKKEEPEDENENEDDTDGEED